MLKHLSRALFFSRKRSALEDTLGQGGEEAGGSDRTMPADRSAAASSSSKKFPRALLTSAPFRVMFEPEPFELREVTQTNGHLEM